MDKSEDERWRRDGRIFSLGEPYQDCFPRFQFDGGQPKPIIRHVLKLLEPKDHSDPELVLLAAEHANDVVKGERRDQRDLGKFSARHGVGDRGTLLSGGQKQRVAIAPARHSRPTPDSWCSVVLMCNGRPQRVVD